MSKPDSQLWIHVRGAREHNLQDISLDIPKHKITVFTGVSGSGKSSLVFDTLAAESQRQLNETFSSFIRHRLAHYGQPDVDSLENLSVAIVIDQKRLGGNARSTVGTTTDIYTLLRLLFSRIGEPFVGYSNVFSFNDPSGMCPHCEGIGTERKVDVTRLIDRSKSLNEGAINFPTFQPGGYRWKRYAYSGLFDNNKKLKDYTADEWDTLLNKSDIKITKPLPGWPASHIYRGILVRFKEDFFSKDSRELETHGKDIRRVVNSGPCPVCHGTRLNKKILSCTIKGKHIADCAAMQIDELLRFIETIAAAKAKTMLQEIAQRLQSLIEIGLGYLSLDRQTSTLSGGESQRIKMVKHLGSSLTDITYVFDEPSVGLHPTNVQQINDLIIRLRDKGNTILIVEHDPDVIAIADHIVDMGPKAGINGGKIMFEGSLTAFAKSGTLTAQYLHSKKRVKSSIRKPSGTIEIKHAKRNNLQDVSVSIPLGVFTAITGVAGSGKSSLIREELLSQHPEAVLIDQSQIHTSKRSNLASYANILDPIRTAIARANNVDASLFSANGKGACSECKGLGIITTDLAFMDPITTTCERCHGKRFNNDVLKLKLRGKNMDDIYHLSVTEAIDFFQDSPIVNVLRSMENTGISYITLGQPLDTFSGGERQRLKLALELGKPSSLYILDEPTTGLHFSDIDNLLGILDSLVDSGSTMLVIEHNLDVIRYADWIIDIGPGAGHEGGKVVFEGLVKDIKQAKQSLTGNCL